MRIEIILFIVAAAIILNIYTEGRLLKKALSFKKYYQMIGVAIGAFSLYWLIKKNPLRAKEMLATSNDYIKYLPVDRNTSDMLSPILDFTSKHAFSGDNGSMNYPVHPMNNMMMDHGAVGGAGAGTNESTRRLMNSGKKATKRSVSETKKKFVAARQNWKCGDCGEQLSAWFEVDHKIRLEYGGSNHIDNLVALCRECHGKKTTIENL
jgi:hypothetical protein